MMHSIAKKIYYMAVIAIPMILTYACTGVNGIKESDLYGRWTCCNLEITSNQGESSNYVKFFNELYFEFLPDGKCIAPDGVLWKPSDRYRWELNDDSLFVKSDNLITDLSLSGKIIELTSDKMVLQEGNGNILEKLSFRKESDIKAEDEEEDAVAHEPVFNETPDLKAFGLKGHVKSVVYQGNGFIDLGFDANGRLTQYGTYTISYSNNDNGECCGKELKRDSEGKITEISYESPESFANFTYNGMGHIASLEYNPDGYMTGIPRFKLTWDSNGQQLSEEIETYDIEWEEKVETTFTDYETDKQGNWTSRKFTTLITTTQTIYDSEDEEAEEKESTSTENRKGVQLREITYY